MPRPSPALISEGFFEFKKSAGEGLCWVKGCARPSRHDRCLCHAHEMRRWHAKSKRTADYCGLRHHAKARGIPFDISPEYWRGLTDAFGYYEIRSDEALSIDRVDATKGYVEGNLRVVTVSLNSVKANKEKFLPEHILHMIERKRQKMQEDNAKFLAMKPEEWDEASLFDQQPPDPDDDNCPF